VSAEAADVRVQPVEHAHQTRHRLLAELHAVLQLQRQLLLAAVVQRGEEHLGGLRQLGGGRGSSVWGGGSEVRG